MHIDPLNMDNAEIDDYVGIILLESYRYNVIHIIELLYIKVTFVKFAKTNRV